MNSYYALEDLVIQVSHQDDKLFGAVNDEMKYYKTDERSNVDGFVRLIPVSKDELTIPDRAVRSTIDENGYISYVHNNTGFLTLKDSYVIKLDPDAKSVEIKYIGNGLKSYHYLRGFIKGLIINVAEDKGFLYMHASAVSFKNKVIVLTGDSNSGKSSFLMRFVRKGAKVISDDSLLTKDKKIVPFTFKSNVDKDFSKRFSIKNELFDNGKFIDKSKTHKKIDYIFILRVWNSESSEIKKVTYSKALLHFVRRYQIGEVFLQRPKKFLFENYASFLEGSKCYEFYAGSNEKEVGKTMFKFLDEN